MSEEWSCCKCGSREWVSASRTGPVEHGGRAIKQCVPCGHYSDDPVVETGKELIRSGDAQQYLSEAMPFDVGTGPRVTLLNATPDPLGSIAAMCGIYEGRVFRHLSEIHDNDRIHYWDQIQNTHLKAPLESVQFHFLIEGVTRSFTHQMVRQRTACFAQESLRFAVKEDWAKEVALPPHLAGLPGDDPKVRVWRRAMNKIEDWYSFLVESGMPAEEARGLLPHDVTTRLHYITNLRGLLEHAGNRLCTQAQFQWRLVLARLKEAVRGGGHWDREVDIDDRWQFMRIADALRPICYQTGKCEFKASFDRACSIRERVDANAALGRPSSEWDKPYAGKGLMEVEGQDAEGIPAINPREWLMNPSAARR